ncbi:MAG: hypothetical protein HZC54_06310 [Verrucomicrobia bacterium]|nr:hypothetical protein [Verrucomicrobiota bacterium]
MMSIASGVSSAARAATEHKQAETKAAAMFWMVRVCMSGSYLTAIAGNFNEEHNARVLRGGFLLDETANRA